MTFPRSFRRSSLRGLGVIAGALGVSACVSTPGPQVTGSGRCTDATLGWAVGQPADEATLKRLSSESGAGLVNPIGPSTITTKDIRQDRLRVFVDKDNIITSTRCE